VKKVLGLVIMFLASCLLIGSMFTVSAGDIPVVLKISGDLELDEGVCASNCLLTVGIGNDEIYSQSLDRNGLITQLAQGFFTDPITLSDTGNEKSITVNVGIGVSGSPILASVAVPNPNIVSEELVADNINTNNDPSESKLLKYNDAQDYYWGRINGSYIYEGSIILDHMTDNSVGSAEIVNGAVHELDLANSAVTNNKLAGDSVFGDKIASNAITEPKIADGTVTAKDLQSDSYTSFFGSSQPDVGDVLTYTGTGTTTTANKMDWQSPGTLTLGSDSVTSSHIVDGTIQSVDLQPNLITVGKIKSSSYGTGGGQVLTSINNTEMDWQFITGDQIEDSTVEPIDLGTHHSYIYANEGDVLTYTNDSADQMDWQPITEDNVAMRDFLKLDPQINPPFECDVSTVGNVYLHGAGAYYEFKVCVLVFTIPSNHYSWTTINQY